MKEKNDSEKKKNKMNKTKQTTEYDLKHYQKIVKEI